jgi:uncharacterized protein involved in exopolysaccharide biosynthesis
MNLLERLAEMTKAVLTTDAELRHQREMMSEMRQEVGKLTGGLQDVRERVTRLEALREADRAQNAAELVRFKMEVERAELRFSRLLPGHKDPSSPPEIEE